MHPSSLHDPRTSSELPAVPARTALVLGGGGSAGNAWLIGVIAGLSDGGLDVTRPDLMIGTSAGSTAAAQLTGAAPATLLADILDAPPLPPRTGPAGPAGPPQTGPARPTLTSDHLARLQATIAVASDAADLRRRMGVVLSADAASSAAAQSRWRTTVAARFPGGRWPQHRLLITAVDAASGEPVVFDGDSGVDLVDAVAASCAGGFAYRIGEHAYIDGGYRLNADNADLATGCARVLVLSPLGGRALTPVEWGTHLATQVDGLRAQGSEVETVFPDDDSRAAFGDNMMNPAARPPAARAGYDQGSALAEQLAGFWS
ncbi:patatin-like phospholipase family protein [Agromyces sp. MMS24-JH15]|uniref:patatin-like phospholipase family protein n=1 Tax=Agromyces sp. MMS24-JH15 TaxID=3243765 RepID=UPI0037485ABA